MALTIDSAFSHLVQSARGLSHAYLFYGADADVHFDLSVRMARHLLRSPLPPNHPDCFLLRPAGRSRVINVDMISDLESHISRTSYEGGAKVVIIHEADRLGVAPANKLLKTLEEPPRDTYFFLTATSADSLLPTILSRCIPVPLIQPKRRAPSMCEKNATVAIWKAVAEKNSPAAAALTLAGRIGDIVDASASSDIKAEQSAISQLKAEAENGGQISASSIAAREEVLEGMQAARAKYHTVLAIIGIRSYLTKIFASIVFEQPVSEYWASTLLELSSAAEAVERGANRKLILESLSIALAFHVPDEIRDLVFAHKPSLP